MNFDHTAAAKRANPFSLVDLQRRVVKYLRVSVTDRCNYRCTYCMPAEGAPVVPRRELLGFEEITRAVRIFVGLGISHVRMTGGEPMVRRGIVDLVQQIASIDGVRDLAMTTNGHLLDRLAGDLRKAGLRRINVSLDSLDDKTFARITRQGRLDKVIDGLEAARAAGFESTKINAVVLRGVNDHEVSDLLRYCAENDLVLRFIEYMPIGLDDYWGPDSFVGAPEIRARLGDAWHLRPVGERGVVGGGPATYVLADSSDGRYTGVKVGFISALSHNFCRSCNRVRLSSTGTLRECLSTGGVLSLRDMMRNGDTDEHISGRIQAALGGKVDGHRFAMTHRTREAMSAIGG